jgi:hypothetical protein
VSKFGDHLRAARLGFGWCEPAQAFVRIIGPLDRAPGPWRVDVATRAAEMSDVPKKLNHRCWWDGDKNGDRLWEICPALRVNGAAPGTFFTDEDGYLVPRSA